MTKKNILLCKFHVDVKSITKEDVIWSRDFYFFQLLSSFKLEVV